jgi:hypothetical protein
MDVPAATIVKPTNLADRPNFLAMVAALVTRKCAPKPSKVKPIADRKSAVHNCCILSILD